MDSHPAKPTNRLADQSSPYLLQHAHNPVDWYPWDRAAFDAAKAADKPIFLSVGYSTCHWCHVMAHESFEDPAVAAVLNEHFIAIKVDREERPDIDAQYMVATQLMTRRGGWPNSVWLTPDGRPWFAGTYFPKDDHFQRPGFVTVLRRLTEAWQEKREQVEEQANQLTAAIRQAEAVEPAGDEAVLSRAQVEQATAAVQSAYDQTHGGFMGAPKFPPHSALRLLAGEYETTGRVELLNMFTHTLDAMAGGGIHDQVGGGFHRYATDSRWFVPHFEKMLYDHGQLLTAYAKGYRLTGHEGYARIIDRTVTWLEREMLDETGGFHSAIDADSEGEEGKFYVWTAEEIRDVLGDDAPLYMQAHGIEEGGNWPEEATGQPTGTNIPYLPQPVGQLAEQRGEEPAVLRQKLDAMHERLFASRDTRIRPHLDDKVLSSWNGLAIVGLAQAGQATGEQRYVELARGAARFVLTHMQRDGELMRVWRAGKADVPGYLDDYAFFIDGLLALHEATGETEWKDHAAPLADRMLMLFGDGTTGAMLFTSDRHEALLGRSTNPLSGGNTPNPNATAASVLTRLGTLTGEQRYFDAAGRCLLAFAEQLTGAQPQQEAMAGALGEHLAATGQTQLRPAPPLTVHVTGPTAAVARGSQTLITIKLSLAAGYHIERDGLQIEADGKGCRLTNVVGPEQETLIGDTGINLTLTIDADAPDEVTAHITVRAQVCDDERCLPTRQITQRVRLAVK